MKNTIADYEAFWQLTEQIQSSVEKEDWEKMTHLSDNRQGLMEKMAKQENERPAKIEDRRYLADLINKTHVLNGEIQGILEKKKGELVKDFSAEKKMLKAYGAQSV